ncbi:MAG: 16S rRNA (guanine(966)-N(2))-methyltransferase RsmD [Chloroflexi bacterium]|nr:16S rRNA (guanine(966)-N(2))-methyltransferase RsmD [Chloroflexota bacterium]
MSHRVIAGIAKGRKLKMVPGEGTRPIMDRVKEALFSILGGNVPEASILDLFAGTGAVGIEALSRGASFARFIDRDKAAIRTVQENLETCRFTDKADVLHTDALLYLERENPTPFEIVYIAPPQYKEIWKEALQKLDAHPQHLAPDALVIVQIDPKEREDLPLQNLTLYDERRYASTLLMFFEYITPEDREADAAISESEH